MLISTTLLLSQYVKDLFQCYNASIQQCDNEFVDVLVTNHRP